MYSFMIVACMHIHVHIEGNEKVSYIVISAISFVCHAPLVPPEVRKGLATSPTVNILLDMNTGHEYVPYLS